MAGAGRRARVRRRRRGGSAATAARPSRARSRAARRSRRARRPAPASRRAAARPSSRREEVERRRLGPAHRSARTRRRTRRDPPAPARRRPRSRPACARRTTRRWCLCIGASRSARPSGQATVPASALRRKPLGGGRRGVAEQRVEDDEARHHAAPLAPRLVGGGERRERRARADADRAAVAVGRHDVGRVVARRRRRRTRRRRRPASRSRHRRRRRRARRRAHEAARVVDVGDAGRAQRVVPALRLDLHECAARRPRRPPHAGVIALLYDVHGNRRPSRPCSPTRAPPAPTAGCWAATTRSSAAGRRDGGAPARARPVRWIRGNGERWTANPPTLPTTRSSRPRSRRAGRCSGPSSSRSLGALPDARADGDPYLPRLAGLRRAPFMPEPPTTRPSCSKGSASRASCSATPTCRSAREPGSSWSTRAATACRSTATRGPAYALLLETPRSSTAGSTTTMPRGGARARALRRASRGRG